MIDSKKIIASAVATAIFGVGGVTLVLNNPKDKVDTSSIISEIQQLEDTVVKDISSATGDNLAAIEKATSDGVSKIEQATSEGVSEINKGKESEPKVESTVSEIKDKEFFEINKTFESPYGSFTVQKVGFYYVNKMFRIWYSAPLKPEHYGLNGALRYGEARQTSYITYKSGTKTHAIGWGGQALSFDFDFTNPSDLSTVSLTYIFDEVKAMTEPVTITFDIPLE